LTLPVLEDRLPELLSSPPSTGSVPAEPPRAFYAQFPQHRVWAEVLEGESHEPLDGCFVQAAAVGNLRVLGVFGVRPERLGLSAVRPAARGVGGFPGDLRGALEEGSLAARKGIGPATLQVVAELVNTGRAGLLGELREEVPPGLVEMLAISGLGVAKIRQIHEVLDVDSLPELEAAALDGRLARLPRFGQKTSENILRGIAFLRQASGLRLSHHAADEAEGLRVALA